MFFIDSCSNISIINWRIFGSLRISLHRWKALLMAECLKYTDQIRISAVAEATDTIQVMTGYIATRHLLWNERFIKSQFLSTSQYNRYSDLAQTSPSDRKLCIISTRLPSYYFIFHTSFAMLISEDPKVSVTPASQVRVCAILFLPNYRKWRLSSSKALFMPHFVKIG
jgi:hypothetical protein